MRALPGDLINSYQNIFIYFVLAPLLRERINSLDDKSFVYIFSKNVKSKVYHTKNSDSVDLAEVAHYEPPHQDLRFLKIQLFSAQELTL